MKKFIALSVFALAVGTAAAYATCRLLGINSRKEAELDDLDDDDYIPDDEAYWDSIARDYEDGTASFNGKESGGGWKKFCDDAVCKQNDNSADVAKKVDETEPAKKRKNKKGASDGSDEFNLNAEGKAK